MLVVLGGTLILDLCVELVVAPGQLGKQWRTFGGAAGPELSAQLRVEFVQGSHSEVRGAETFTL